MGDVVIKVPVHLIAANRQQPRVDFNEESLQELAESIRRSGVIQPLIVTQSQAGRYELVAGERRLRASRLAGLSEVPAIIRHNVDSEELLELALVENVQREDLNPLEEAKAYQRLIENFSYTQDQVAQAVGKSRVTVANSLRLLQLPKVVQDDLVQGRMSQGHARALLALPDLQEQLLMRDRILQEQLTVRDVEAMIRERHGRVKSSTARGAASSRMTPQLRSLVDDMTRALGTKVVLKPRSSTSGALVIEYYSLQDLDRIYRKVAAQ